MLENDVKDVLVLDHSDGVSCSVHFNNGAVVHSTESGELVGESPEGEMLRMDIDTLNDHGFGYALEYFERGPSEEAEVRMMTPEEEIRFAAAFERCGPQVKFNARIENR